MIKKFFFGNNIIYKHRTAKFVTVYNNVKIKFHPHFISYDIFFCRMIITYQHTNKNTCKYDGFCVILSFKILVTNCCNSMLYIYIFFCCCCVVPRKRLLSGEKIYLFVFYVNIHKYTHI